MSTKKVSVIHIVLNFQLSKYFSSTTYDSEETLDQSIPCSLLSKDQCKITCSGSWLNIHSKLNELVNEVTVIFHYSRYI